MDNDKGSALISFGADPADPENKGVGIYSMPYCLSAYNDLTYPDDEDKIATNC